MLSINIKLTQGKKILAEVQNQASFVLQQEAGRPEPVQKSERHYILPQTTEVNRIIEDTTQTVESDSSPTIEI